MHKKAEVKQISETPAEKVNVVTEKPKTKPVNNIVGMSQVNVTAIGYDIRVDFADGNSKFHEDGVSYWNDMQAIFNKDDWQANINAFYAKHFG